MPKSPKPVKCCICTLNLSEDRVKQRAVTCSKQCADELKRRRRQRYERKHCRACGAPSTPEERKLFQQWRRSRGEKKGKPGRPTMTVEEKARAKAERDRKRGIPVQEAFTEMIEV